MPRCPATMESWLCLVVSCIIIAYLRVPITTVLVLRVLLGGVCMMFLCCSSQPWWVMHVLMAARSS